MTWSTPILDAVCLGPVCSGSSLEARVRAAAGVDAKAEDEPVLRPAPPVDAAERTIRRVPPATPAGNPWRTSVEVQGRNPPDGKRAPRSRPGGKKLFDSMVSSAKA